MLLWSIVCVVQRLTRSLPANDIFCGLSITNANSLDPDQARQNIGPDLDPNCEFLVIFQTEFFENVKFEKKISRRQTHACKDLTLRRLSSYFEGHDVNKKLKLSGNFQRIAV